MERDNTHMGTVYRTKQGEVFSAETYITLANGDKYALNVSQFPNITAHNLADIATLGDTFSFIIRYFPDFEHSQEVAELDDLDCLIDGECNEEKTERITLVYGSDPQRWLVQRDEIFSYLLKEAIKAYKENN